MQKMKIMYVLCETLPTLNSKSIGQCFWQTRL